MAGDDPINSNGQQERVLAGNKRKKCIRNTLINPYKTEWPTVTEEEEENVLSLVRMLLLRLNRPKLHIKLGAMRSVAKEDRRNFRRQQRGKLMKEAGAKDWSELRSSVALGVNHVSRSLEKGEAVSVLVARDVEPAMITRFLVPLAATRGLPLLALGGLARATQQVLGVRCVALAFKNTVESESHPFHPLHDRVKQLSALLSPSNPTRAALHPVKTNAAVKNEQCGVCESISSTSSPPPNLLRRTSNNYRVFLPQKNENDIASTSGSLAIAIPLVEPSRKSALLSISRKAKLKSNPSRVRFAEGVVINGSPPFTHSSSLDELNAASKGCEETLVLAPSLLSKVTAPTTTSIIANTITRSEKDKMPQRKRKEESTNVRPLKIKKVQSNPNKRDS